MSKRRVESVGMQRMGFHLADAFQKKNGEARRDLRRRICAFASIFPHGFLHVHVHMYSSFTSFRDLELRFLGALMLEREVCLAHKAGWQVMACGNMRTRIFECKAELLARAVVTSALPVNVSGKLFGCRGNRNHDEAGRTQIGRCGN